MFPNRFFSNFFADRFFPPTGAGVSIFVEGLLGLIGLEPTYISDLTELVPRYLGLVAMDATNLSDLVGVE